MVGAIPYVCGLLDAAGEVSTTVHLTARTDTDAILLGNTLEHEHPGCSGFEIRVGERLAYLRKAEPLSASPSAG